MDSFDRCIQDGSLEYHHSAKDTLHRLEYWKKLLDAFGLVYLTTDRIFKEIAADRFPPLTRKVHSAATENCYVTNLTAALTYADDFGRLF